jgi:hypothetical protein
VTSLFHEEQSYRQPRVWLLLAIPPVILLGVTIWQVGLGYRWRQHGPSNGDLVTMTVFIWLVYVYLLRVRLVTDVQPGTISIQLRGLWRHDRIAAATIKTASVVDVDPVRDFGGYGIRAVRGGKAYLAGRTPGVRLDLRRGGFVVIGSVRPEELLAAINRASPSHEGHEPVVSS